MRRLRTWFYWHLTDKSRRLYFWASVRHGRALATEKRTKYSFPQSYTIRMRNYYGVMGRPIPNNSATQRQMEVELRG